MIRDTPLIEGTKSTTAVATTIAPPPPTPVGSTTSSHIIGDESALETALESRAFAAVAAEEGVDLASARRLVRAAVLGNTVPQHSKEAAAQIEEEIDDYF